MSIFVKTLSSVVLLLVSIAGLTQSASPDDVEELKLAAL